MNFDLFIEEIQKNNYPVFDVEIFQHGRITHQWHKNGIKPRPIYSATKTITSLGVGMAVDEGKLDLETSVYEQLKDWIPDNLGETQIQDLKKISLKRLLSMSVDGYPFRPEGAHWLDTVLQIKLPDVEKKIFSYTNVSAYLAGVMAEHAVGEPLYQYLCRKLFEPLGIQPPTYQTCPDGHFYGATGMELTVQDLRKIGQLLLQEGQFAGKQLVSKEYVSMATSMQQMNREGGYGYFIWIQTDGFSIRGKWGQKCFVFPKEEKIITYLSCMEHGAKNIEMAMEKYLL